MRKRVDDEVGEMGRVQVTGAPGGFEAASYQLGGQSLSVDISSFICLAPHFFLSDNVT